MSKQSIFLSARCVSSCFRSPAKATWDRVRASDVPNPMPPLVPRTGQTTSAGWEKVIQPQNSAKNIFRTGEKAESRMTKNPWSYIDPPVKLDNAEQETRCHKPTTEGGHS